jgi:hypothetical protein
LLPELEVLLLQAHMVQVRKLLLAVFQGSGIVVQPSVEELEALLLLLGGMVGVVFQQEDALPPSNWGIYSTSFCFGIDLLLAYVARVLAMVLAHFHG